MIRLSLCSLMFGVWPAVMFAAEPPVKAPSLEEVRLPILDAPKPGPTPKPPSPGAPVKLGASQLYVVDSDTALTVLASPEGIVGITSEAGPIKIRALFVENSSGRYSTRTYKGQFVYTVEASKSGRVELLIVRADGKGAVLRRTLDVDAGEGPKPPPKPKPDPKPVDPVVPVDAFQSAIQKAYRGETASDKAATTAKLASLYRMAAATTAKDTTVKTYADLFSDMQAAGKVLIPVPGQLPEVRKVIGERINKTLQPGGGQIDRALAEKELKAVADALATVK